MYAHFISCASCTRTVQLCRYCAVQDILPSCTKSIYWKEIFLSLSQAGCVYTKLAFCTFDLLFRTQNPIWRVSKTKPDRNLSPKDEGDSELPETLLTRPLYHRSGLGATESPSELSLGTTSPWALQFSVIAEVRGAFFHQGTGLCKSVREDLGTEKVSIWTNNLTLGSGNYDLMWNYFPWN